VTLASQSPTEVAVLFLTGIIMSMVTAVLLTDYRNLLTKYAQQLVRSYQSPLYQKVFLWTKRQRTAVSDEGKVRTTIRAVAAVGSVFGIVIVVIEIAALVTGHVT
jgi:hypothetical protein